MLLRPHGLEAVLRVRCTAGVTLKNFHGHYYMRSSDLMALPNISPDNGFAFEIGVCAGISDLLCSLYPSYRWKMC